MNWKERLLDLESQKAWDDAIIYMQNIVTQNPYDLDAYLGMLYLLMNLLVEEDYNNNKHDYYADLCKRYFIEAYTKFREDPEFLFYASKIAFMSEWYFNIAIEQAEEMSLKAYLMEPENTLYQSTYYLHLDEKDPKNRQALIDYASKIVSPNSPIKEILVSKGSLGAYLLEIITGSNKRILSNLSGEA